jgi:GntR family transcriptional regulator
VGEEWTYAMGLRRTNGNAGSGNGSGTKADGRPICVTRLYLSPVLKGIETRLRGRTGAVYMLIERDYGLSIQRVEQELCGVLLDADDAANLGAKPDAPALRIVRRYYGENDQLLQVADSVHPSDRFTYRMELRK